MNVIPSMSLSPLFCGVSSVMLNSESVYGKNRWVSRLQSICNAPFSLKRCLAFSRAERDEPVWKVHGMALQRCAQAHNAVRDTDVHFLRRPKRKALFVQSLVGLTMQIEYQLVPMTPTGRGESSTWGSAIAASPESDSYDTASSALFFLHQISSSAYAFLSRIDRRLQFPMAAATNIPNRKKIADDDLHIKIRYANIESVTFSTDVINNKLKEVNKAISHFLWGKSELDKGRDYRYSPGEIVGAAIRFIKHEINGEKLLAMRLRRYSGFYGGWDNEPVSGIRHQDINRRWITNNVFNASIETFVVNEISQGEKLSAMTVKSLYTMVLKKVNAFFLSNDDDINKTDFIDWIWKNVVLHQLPILGFTQSKRVMALELKKFSWGEIHAGMLWLQHITQRIQDISPDEASSIGCFLLAGIKDGTLPYSWVSLFTAPAAIYTLKNNTHVEGDALSIYFEARESFVNQTYPLESLMDLMANYKKRSQLNYSTSQFLAQNVKIAEHYAIVDKFIITAAFINLPKQDYDFLYSSTIKKIDAEFTWVKPWYFFGMTPEEAGIVRSQHTIKLPATVDLFSADNGIEERFYAYSYQQGNVKFKRLESTADYYALFDDKRPQSDNGYTLIIHPGGLSVKHHVETLHIAITRMVEIHREKMNAQLFEYGNERSTGEIITDFALALIPFYTCINESLRGNVVLAVQACMMDGMLFAIPSAQFTLMAARMAEFLGVEALMAVRYFVSRLALQMAVKNALQLGMKHFLYYGIHATAQHLGWRQIVFFARTIDPGFELCFLIGRRGVREALRLGHVLHNLMPGLKKSMSTVTDDILAALPLGHIFNHANVFTHTDKLPLKKVGFDISSSYEVYVPLSMMTGEVYGHKYYRLADGTFKAVPHNTKHEFINLNMLEHGMGGGGAPLQGQIWAAERQDADNERHMTPSPSPSSSVNTGERKRVDAQLISELVQMGFSEFLLAGGRNALAIAHNVSPDELAIYMDEARRLTPAGEELLTQGVEDISEDVPTKSMAGLRPQNGYQIRYLLDKWLMMPEQEQVRVGGIEGFAQQHHIGAKKLRNYLLMDGTLNVAGIKLMTINPFDPTEINKPNTSRRRIMLKKRRNQADLHRRLLTRWSAMTPVQRHQMGGLIEFAQRHQADPEKLRSYLTESQELNSNGRRLLRKVVPTSPLKPVRKQNAVQRAYNGNIHRRLLNEWHAMTPIERNAAGGIVKFSEKYDVDASKLRAYLTLDDDLNMAGLRFASYQKRNSNPSKSYASDTHLQPSTLLPVTALADAEKPNEIEEQPGMTLPTPTIKEEPMDAEPPSPRHQIDDDLPVLQHPQDNTHSVLGQAEGSIDALKVTHWNELSDVFATLPRKDQPAVKQAILAAAKTWLRSEGGHGEIFRSLVYAAQDLTEGPDRGMSIFARRPISQFEVIGPYSGVLHASVESLHAEMARVGAVNVNTYLWATRSSQRAVSGFGHGNTLSLINTGHLPGYPQWRENNLTAIRVGKNLIFYVAMRDIRVDEELLVSYGESFNPTGTR